MRGKLTTRQEVSHATRITPAHAGKTGKRPTASRGHADHPRTCGENGISGKFNLFRLGSPPHMRGKQTSSGSKGVAQSGSPPHMRGKLMNYERGQQPIRITPAHAGKTKRTGVRVYNIPDHPRTCGENLEIILILVPKLGSPPHMRGKQKPERTCLHSHRITPAHAGKTLRKCYIAEVNPHPIRQFPLTSHKVVVSSGNPTKLCVILLYQIESILLKSGVYSPVHPPAFVLQGLTCQL